MSNLDLLKSDDGKRRLGQLHQSICSRCHQHVAPIRNAVETELSERNVDVDPRFPCCVRDFLGKSLELSVKLGSSSSFLLFLLEFLLVSVSMFALSISCLIKRHICSLAVELHIFGFAFTNNDGILKVDMDQDNQLTHARLEKEMFDV